MLYIEQLKIFKLYHKGELIEFKSIDEMKEYIITTLDFMYKIKFSSNPYSI